MRILFANLVWFISTLPDALRFRIALGDPAKAQARTAARRRPTRPEDVILEEPTSGTTGGTKWIPYTEQLRREFMRAINPWMASIYLRHPCLLLCTHYWSVSPYTEVRQPKDGPRRGFAEDREYLGRLRARLTAALFPVTAAVAGERDPERHLLATARALVASRRLGLVSVWHPSAFLRLLNFMSEHADELTGDARLRESLAARRFRDVWPRLRLISCWDAAFAAADADLVRRLFPGVELEGKGLLATEGVVTFPWFGRRVAAVTSHTLAFEEVDGTSGEPVAGQTIGVEALEMGRRYGVVLTTGNGFENYRLGDVVECVGFERRTPRLEFRYRAGGMVDLHGEKMHPAFAAEVIGRLGERFGRPRFAAFEPRDDQCGYRLLWESDGGPPPSATDVDALLSANYHYAHAVNLRQLRPVEVVPVSDGLGRWCRLTGTPPAAAKVPAVLKPAAHGEPTLGFCTWLLRGRSLPDTIAFLAREGYRSVAFLQDVMGVGGSEREEAAAAIRELGFAVTYHGCVQWWVGQDQRIDDGRMRAMFEDVRWWHEHTNGVVSCCSDRVAGPTAEGPNRRYLEGETRRLVQCERDFFEPLGIGYGIENCFRRYCLHEEMQGLADSVCGPAPHLGSILDVGHAHVHVCSDRNDGMPLEEYIDRIPVRIWELHITDNHGSSDEHIAPGEGTLDFRALRRAMDRRRFDGPISMEVCKDAAHGDNCFDLSVSAHRDRIRRIRDDFLRLYQ